MTISVFTEVFKVEYINSPRKFVFQTQTLYMHQLYLQKIENSVASSKIQALFTIRFYAKYLHTNFHSIYVNRRDTLQCVSQLTSLNTISQF